MKIAQISCVFPPYKGGIGNVAFQFSKILQASNHQVTVLTPMRKDAAQKINSGIKVLRLKPFFKYGNSAFLPQLLFKLKNFDIVHLHYPFFGTAEIVWLAKLLFNKKFKLYIHYHMEVVGLSLIAKILSWPANLIKNSLFKQADIITCASLDYVEHSDIAKIYKKYPQKFVEIPFGVDTKKFTPQEKKDEDRLNLLFVGGLDKAHYFKGLDILLKAASQLQIKNYELQIVGDGDLKPRYQKQAQKLGLGEKIKFLGRVADGKLPAIYQQANLFILPSINKNEAFGLVLLEAMASGVPIIASNLAGVRSVFQDGVQGFLVEPNSVIGLKEKIENILNDKEKRQKMSLAARKLALEKYSLEKVKEKLEKIFAK